MYMFRIQPIVTVLFLTVIIAGTATISAAQNAPSGACVVDGGWCWPLTPAPSGAPCECNTQNGLLEGYIQ